MALGQGLDGKLNLKQTISDVERLERAFQALQESSSEEDASAIVNLVRKKLIRAHQERSIRQFSLSDRQARDMQSELLLTLVNQARDQEIAERKQYYHSKFYDRSLREFLYR